MCPYWSKARGQHLAAREDSVALPRIQICCEGGTHKPGGLGVQLNPHPSFLQPPKGQGHLVSGREPPAQQFGGLLCSDLWAAWLGMQCLSGHHQGVGASVLVCIQSHDRMHGDGA